MATWNRVMHHLLSPESLLRWRPQPKFFSTSGDFGEGTFRPTGSQTYMSHQRTCSGQVNPIVFRNKCFIQSILKKRNPGHVLGPEIDHVWSPVFDPRMQQRRRVEPTCCPKVGKNNAPIVVLKLRICRRSKNEIGNIITHVYMSKEAGKKQCTDRVLKT